MVPLVELENVTREGQTVSEAKEILIRNIPPQIDFIPDLFESVSQSKIEGVVLSAKKILEILKLARISRNSNQLLRSNSAIAPSLSEYQNLLFSDKLFEHHIEKVIDENGEIKEKASQKLSEIRKQIREKQRSLVKSINSIMKSLDSEGIVREDYLTLRDGRMVIPVKVEHKRQIRGFIHSESATGQTVYIEPEQTLELNNEIITLGFAEKREIEKLLKDITSLIGKESDKLKESLMTISYIDSIFARAKYSIETIGSFPSINNMHSFYIKDARHPVLLKKLGRDKAIPLSFKLDDQRIVVITGPNAGGKTVVLKTVGLLVLLRQSGIHIPVDPYSNFHLFEDILVDIGDEQSLEDDLSTFSSHLTNLKNILSAGLRVLAGRERPARRKWLRGFGHQGLARDGAVILRCRRDHWLPPPPVPGGRPPTGWRCSATNRQRRLCSGRRSFCSPTAPPSTRNPCPDCRGRWPDATPQCRDRPDNLGDRVSQQLAWYC